SLCPPPAKPGLCPRKRARRGAAACPSRCADDRDCPGDRKCCFSGCGLACTSPHTGTPPKPGTCPRDFTRCLRLEPPLCTNDSVCPGWHKCCPRECRLRCTPPAEGTWLPAQPPAPSRRTRHP
uniref:WAP domain-containing protein n=1 Tax=Anser brachyrhynchus TaxID=132585 RepID=A0A8B9BV75_9AVES